MNVFLSWSGTLSHAVAEGLASWLPQVIQSVRPWLSSQDIDKGARWFEEIGESLSTTDFGILCLTSANIAAPWILFEAGALSKTLGQARVCPLLVNIRNVDLQGPLTQFNTAGLASTEIKRLVETLNSRLPVEQRRSESQLAESFGVWWPHLEQRFTAALEDARGAEPERLAPKRNTTEVLDELLELTRVTAQQVNKLSATLPRATVTEQLDQEAAMNLAERRRRAEAEAAKIRAMMAVPKKKITLVKKPPPS